MEFLQAKSQKTHSPPSPESHMVQTSSNANTLSLHTCAQPVPPGNSSNGPQSYQACALGAENKGILSSRPGTKVQRKKPGEWESALPHFNSAQ